MSSKRESKQQGADKAQGKLKQQEQKPQVSDEKAQRHYQKNTTDDQNFNDLLNDDFVKRFD